MHGDPNLNITIFVNDRQFEVGVNRQTGGQWLGYAVEISDADTFAGGKWSVNVPSIREADPFAVIGQLASWITLHIVSGLDVSTAPEFKPDDFRVTVGAVKVS